MTTWGLVMEPGPRADTLPAPAPSPAPARKNAGRRSAEPAAEQHVERYEDGVPVQPAWLGRPDLP
ncbi:hypothetical protein [Streptomyces sp. NPDC047985]|uniref:hypothetical protein n=1 Tax=unclassified Streptomyces TaxID=2593676 RepID=UPI00342E3FDC